MIKNIAAFDNELQNLRLMFPKSEIFVDAEGPCIIEHAAPDALPLADWLATPDGLHYREMRRALIRETLRAALCPDENNP